MCTKIPYPNPRLAKRALAAISAKGQKVRGIHPCYDDHPGQWHVTSRKGRGRSVRLQTPEPPARA